MRIVGRVLLATLCAGLLAGCNDVLGPRVERSRLDTNRDAELFDFIAQATDDRVELLDVTYDETLGFPRSVVYDGDRRIADNEVSFTVTDMLPINRGDARVHGD